MRAILIGVSIAAICIALTFAPLAACAPDFPSTDAGADPDISACCDWFNPVLRVLYDLPSPASCLCSYTEPGMQRWLTCLAGIESYTCDKRGMP